MLDIPEHNFKIPCQFLRHIKHMLMILPYINIFFSSCAFIWIKGSAKSRYGKGDKDTSLEDTSYMNPERPEATTTKSHRRE